jgi:transcriptional regulator with XRE-family HTH domain
MTRLHYIPEWAELRRITQAEIARELGVDKSAVSRWFKGALPLEKHILAISEVLAVEPNDLFHDPHEDWMSRFLRERSREEQERIKATLEAAFPKKVA